MFKIKNKKINISNIAILSTTISVWSIFSFAGDKVSASTCDTLIGDAQKKCVALEKKAQAYQDIIAIKVKQQATLQKQMTLIDAEQSKNKNDLQKVHDKFQTVSQQIASLEKRISSEEEQIEQQKTILSGLMRIYYEDYQQGVLDIVLVDKEFSEFMNQADYMQQSSLKVSDVLKSIQDIKLDLENQKTELEGKRSEHEQLQGQLEEKNLTLQKTETQKQILLGQTKAEEAKYQDLLSDIEDEISSLEQNLSSTVNMANLPPDKSGYFTWPVNPHILTQGYGKTSFAKTSGIYKNNFHNGYDFGIKFGNLYAAKGGTVIGSGDNGKYAYGKWLAINHGDGLVTLYGHLSAKNVSKGSKVTEGQKIGTTGNTGNSTGPHLHFSVFASNTFKTVESSYVKGLMIPTGAPVTPKKYL
ncbi:MAG: hypothetical protein UT50_C0001G0037 [Candidatus Moranbacteria bacterium GW2011_GWA2_39_41]|nr:MAG: hypothetical protein UT50_C0001G0037 [Candidatus Moranbacteria bacterium GW2011_GWA2_39_41]